jgi:hypothetical protein
MNVQTPTIDNVSAPVAGTEYSYALPASTKRFMLQNRGIGKIQLSYNAGDTGTNYLTVTPGNSLSEENIDPTASITLYFQTDKASQIIEVVSWA